MTKVNNGKITSSSSAAPKIKTSAKAAAVLARLDEMSVSLADDISHYDDDATFDMSIKEEAAKATRKSTAADASLKKLERMVESPKVELYNDDVGSHASSEEDSTVYEEISYAMARLNNETREKKKVETGARLVDDLKVKKATNHEVKKVGASAVPKLPALPVNDRKDDLQSLRMLESCSFNDDDVSDASSDGFSIEEAEEVEVIVAKNTPLHASSRERAPLMQKVPKTLEVHRSSSPKQVKSVKSFVRDFSFDDDVLDDSSIFDIQKSKTPKIKNRKALVEKSTGGKSVSSSKDLDNKSRASKVSVGKSAASKSGASHSSEKKSTTSKNIDSSLFPTHLLDVTDNSTARTKAPSTDKSKTTHGTWGLFSRAAPQTPFESSSESSKVSSKFNPPSHLSLDIESGSAGRRGKKRSKSSESRVSSMLSLDDTDVMIREALQIKHQKSSHRRNSALCVAAVVLLAGVAAVVVIMTSMDHIPGFLHEPLSKAGIIPSSPTTANDTELESKDVEPKGVPGTMWYPDFDLFKCVQSCDDADVVTCGGKMKEWEKGVETLEQCCLDNFSTFIGNDWSLKDCIAISDPAVISTAKAASTEGPTYMPSAVVQNAQPDKEDKEADASEAPSEAEAGAPTYMPSTLDDANHQLVESGTTPWAVNQEYAKFDNDSPNYVLELDENYNPINPTTGTPNIPDLTTEAPEESKPYVLELDENYNPINSTSTAVATEMNQTTSNATTATVDNANNTTNKLVYYADWDNKECLQAAKSDLKTWQKTYPTENECCLENFKWDVNGNCFQTMSPVTPSPSLSFGPSELPTVQPTVPVLVFTAFNNECIRVYKSSLKQNAKSYISRDECNRDNNYEQYQPTLKPTFIPTISPTIMPSASPSNKPSNKPSSKPTNKPTLSPTQPESHKCTVEFCEYQITSDYALEYRVNVPEDVSVDECTGCTVSMKLTYDGETSWISVGFSTSGEMIGSEAIIGVPGMTPAKYYLNGKYEGAVQLMDQDQQTLSDAKVEVVDGQTILSFAKPMVEQNEVAISTGNNIFLWAHGTSVENTYHGVNKGSFDLNLLQTSQMASDSETKTVNQPSNRPTPKPTTKQTMNSSSQSVDASSPTTTSVAQDPLLALLLAKSPGSSASLVDTESAQYSAWKWLTKNPDLNAITDEQKVQRWTLATFYTALHGNEWTSREGWLDISGEVVDECTWYNIECDSSGNVISMDLRNNYLWGDIPQEISLLETCESLGLSSNYLAVINPVMFSMKSLKVLDLDDNGIKELPSGFDASTELEELYLSHNKITYIPDTIFELKGLKAFFILDNQIETTLPSAIGQLTLLEELDLEMNYFTGTIPDELYELTSLRKLWLFGNMFTGKFSPKFSAMSSLNVLDLTQNYITGELPPDIGLFDNITELHLKQNMITGQIPSELSALTTLTVLDISMNLLDSTLISGIGELENLVTLRLDNNYRLDMNGTLLSYGIKGSIPSSLGSLKQLKELRLDNNYIQGPLPSTLGGLESLEILRIESNDLHGSIPSQLGNAANLQYLHLWSNYIEGPIPSSLGNLGQLKELFLDDNELTGSIPSELGKLTSATYIALASNNLESSIPSELGQLSSIETLELQSNYLYGKVPQELASSSLVVLQLEDNDLYGDIPNEVCQSNTIAYLSGNCAATTESTASPVSAQMNNSTESQTVVARNGVRTGGISTRNRAKNSGRNVGRKGARNGARKGGGKGAITMRKHNTQTSRQLSNSAPAQSPWSCNCCTECLPV